jgi:hypothetical protein
VSQNGDLERFYWASGAWQKQTIPHWGNPLVPGSMIQGASGETIYGVNTAGKIFITWKDAGVITFALINPPGGVNVHSNSLVLSHDSGLFAVSQNGDLERFYWASGAWQKQTIPHWGAPLVPGSMIQGASGETIYGVNTAGKIFITWKDAGVITFALINPPGGVNVYSNSLVLSHDSGLFAVSQNGDLDRFYWASGAWQNQTIPHWGNPLVPGSMIQGASGETIYGVNTAGDIFITWKDAGVITFALIP